MALINKYEGQSVFDVLLINGGAISGLFEFLELNELDELNIPEGDYLAPVVLNALVVDFFSALSPEAQIVSNGGVAHGAPSFLTLNGADFLELAQGSLIDVQLLDQDDNPIVPISVVGNVVKVDVPEVVPNAWWTRPAGWLAMPTINAGDNKFAGLAAVYENDDLNYYYLSGWSAINWGDGNTTDTAHQFIYSTITSDVLVDADGLNYKTVLVTANLGSGSLVTEQANKSYNWLDILMDGTTLTGNLLFNYQSVNYKTERFRIRNIGCSYIGLNNFKSIKVFECLSFTAYSGLENSLRYGGDFRNNDGSPTVLSFPNAVSLQAFFYYSGISRIGNVYIPNCVIISAMFAASQLGGYLNLYTSSSLTTMNSLLEGAGVKELYISDCSGVTNIGYFKPNGTLEACHLTGITTGFDVSGQKMKAADLDDMFTEIGTWATGSNVIDVRSNPGSLTCSPSIATSKGYTVLTA